MKKPQRASRSLEAMVAANKGGSQRLSRSGASHRCRQRGATITAARRILQSVRKRYEADLPTDDYLEISDAIGVLDRLESRLGRRPFGANDSR